MYFADDERLAIKLQFENSPYKESLKKPYGHKRQSSNVIDPKLEYLDPTPNIHDLFVKFDKRFFWNSLGMIEVKWCYRMAVCAGVCTYYGPNGLCSISLSAPLLSLRSRKDLVETLLHEMIHAYLFVTANRKDREEHGPEFHRHMHRINKVAGTNITVYHDFHDEVKYYDKHIWRCNGPCRHGKPLFGLVKRASNKPPGPNDIWWKHHKQECGGTFVKISEPDNFKKPRSKNYFDEFFNGGFWSTTPFAFPTGFPGTLTENISFVFKDPFDGRSVVVGTNRVTISNQYESQGKTESSKVNETVNGKSNEPVDKTVNEPEKLSPSVKKLDCPFCKKNFSEMEIEVHVNHCLENNSLDSGIDNAVKDSDNNVNENKNDDLVGCPVCNEEVKRDQVNDHLESCLKCTFENEPNELEADEEIECMSVPCPCCMKWVLENEINVHVDQCLTVITL